MTLEDQTDPRTEEERFWALPDSEEDGSDAPDEAPPGWDEPPPRDEREDGDDGEPSPGPPPPATDLPGTDGGTQPH